MATMNTTDAALALDTDPRTLRKFLRSPEGFDSKVGKGARWSIEKRDMRSLAKRFAKWDEARKATETPEADITPTDDNTPETDES